MPFNAQNCSELALTLLTVSHPDWPTPIRLVNDVNPFESRGSRFEPFPFELSLPSSEAGKPPRARITISNITREITQQIVELTESPALLIEVVEYSKPGAVIYAAAGMVLENPTWNAKVITADLAMRDITQEPASRYRITPGAFPAAYAG